MERLVQSPLLFAVFFAVLWLAVTSLLGFLSGWYSLMRKYPDQDEAPILQLKWQSGSMGLGVDMRGILNIAVCEHGLRIGMMKIFGVFCRDLFVPWDEIEVTRKQRFFLNAAELRFGNSALGKLTIPDEVADQLARAASGHWPEAGPISQQSKADVLISELKRWVFVTILAALFFTLVPRIGSPNGPFPPIWVAIGFPAVAFGFSGVYRYFSRTKQ
jgi:hypothetical protein